MDVGDIFADLLLVNALKIVVHLVQLLLIVERHEFLVAILQIFATFFGRISSFLLSDICCWFYDICKTLCRGLVEERYSLSCLEIDEACVLLCCIVIGLDYVLLFEYVIRCHFV